MPRIVDYSSRFDAIREAAFTIVLRDGAPALSMSTAAQELNTSVSTIRRTLGSAESLPKLAHQWIDKRERFRVRPAVPDELPEQESWARSLNALLHHLPYNAARADDARVRGAVLAHDRGRPWAIELSTSRASHVRALAQSVFADLELVPATLDVEVRRLHALVDGVIAHVCVELIPPAECTAVLRAHALASRAACHRDAACDAA